VAGGIHDIDLGILILNGSILGQIFL
jgi:hypothetical protein